MVSATPERSPLPKAQSVAGTRWPVRESILIGLLAFCLYVTPALSVVQLNPDVVEYVDVARRLLNGEGFRLGV